MDLLERIFGVETMARVREEARQAQARALPRAPSNIASQVPPAAASVSRPRRSAESASAGGFIDALPADFPTSILGTAAADTPPLLTAFASREALLAAIVYSEALAPPVALR